MRVKPTSSNGASSDRPAGCAAPATRCVLQDFVPHDRRAAVLLFHLIESVARSVDRALKPLKMNASSAPVQQAAQFDEEAYFREGK